MPLAALNDQATTVFCEVVEGLAEDELTRASRCAWWSVRDVMEHQAGNEVGWQRAFAGIVTDADEWAPVPTTTADLIHAVERTSASLDDTGPAEVWVPVITARRMLRRGPAIRARILDLVIHAWDLAPRAASLKLDPDGDLVACVLGVAKGIPADGRAEPGSMFAPVPRVATATCLDPFSLALLLTGRDPRDGQIDRWPT